jgi:hypothetical protein
MRCLHYDCGWCYAPEEVKNNANNGACIKPFECPTYLNIVNEINGTRHSGGDPSGKTN